MNHPFVLRLAALFLLCLSISAPARETDTQQQEAVPAQSGALPLDEIRTFTAVFAKIKSDYVEEVDDRKLLENAIRGMLEGLDPHSAYLDKEDYLELQESTTGEFGGLGLEVGTEDGFLKVISPIDDTPAQRAGIKTGDLIIRLDDTPVKGMSLNDAIKLMRGKPGTDIGMTIMRDGEEKPIKLTLTRDIIKVQSVRQRMLGPGFGYLRVSSFQTHSAEDARKGIEKLMAEAPGGLRGLVLDLRNNPGGTLSAAVGISDLFLDSGLIVYTEGRVKEAQMRFSAKPEDMLNDAPMVVLVNAGSASASEIVAGALQDQKRAVIMGQKTFGKGSVQTILPLTDTEALKLTTARYYTPSGRSIQAEGIVPDILINPIIVKEVQDEALLIKEADLSRHLENPTQKDDEEQEPAAGKEKSKEKDKDAAKKPGATKTQDAPAAEQTAGAPADSDDYALSQALNVLKALALRQTKSG
jgi:carboxyl-terminal processing protease